MAGRGMLFDEGPTACPFVALEVDRDRRSAEPDPRHRCYAEPSPAPRALAHQREFCLSPGFGGCPIFQDWAVRAAARPVPLRPAPDLGALRDEQAGAEQLAAFGSGASVPQPAQQHPPPPQPTVAQPGLAELPEFDLPPRGTPAKGAQAELPVGGSERPAAGEDAADEPATDEPGAPEPDRAPQSDVAPRRRRAEDWPPAARPPVATAPAAEPAVGAPIGDVAVHPHGPPERARHVDYAQRAEQPERRQAMPTRREDWTAQRADLIPSWDRARHAGYPGLRRRFGVSDSGDVLRRLTRMLAFAAVAALAVALLLLAPAFLGAFLAPETSPPVVSSPSPTLGAPTPTPLPTPSPEPSLRSYTIQPGDTLLGIAVEFGLTLDQLMAANPSITDPNLIQVGQVIVIPPDDFGLPTAPPIPTPRPSATP